MKSLIIQTQRLRRHGLKKLRRRLQKRAEEKAESRAEASKDPAQKSRSKATYRSFPKDSKFDLHPSPPAYYECVDTDVTLDKKDLVVVTEREITDSFSKEGESTEHTELEVHDSETETEPKAANETKPNASEKADYEAETENKPYKDESPKDAPRGRRPEILYRSQLHDLALRKSVNRPSPSKPRRKPSSNRPTASYSALAETNAAFVRWHQDYRMVQITALCFALFCFLFAW